MGVEEATPERAAGDTHDRVADLCRAVENQLAVLAGRAAAVAAAAAEIEVAAAGWTEPDTEVLRRLATAVAGARSDAAAAPVLNLFDRIAGEAGAETILPIILGARSATLRARAIDLAVRNLTASAPEPVLAALAGAVDSDPRHRDPAFLEHFAGLVEGSPALLEPGRPEPLRRFAARVLDRSGEPAATDAARRLLGAGPHRRLEPYLDFTRAGFVDLVALSPCLPPPCLESLERAEAQLGRAELGRLIGELGWSRVAWRLEVEHLVGLAANGGFPLVVTSVEADLFGHEAGLRPVWKRWLAIAFGAGGGIGDRAAPGREAVERFRRSNLLHAEVLSELMTMAPLDAGRARRLLAMVGRLADDFADLFGGVDNDASVVQGTFRRLARPVEEALAGCDDDAPVPATAAHTLLAFEDPARLEDVASVHGLKRLLHQRGLKAAFRLFRSASGADRTVDVAAWGEGQPITVVRRLRYVDFEPAGDGQPPLVVRLAIDAWRRHVVHGLTRLPDLEVFCYGNEVQAYLNFRNHPAFLRVDLAPPLRGGMLDLEYFAVSQYELDRHPDLELPAIREAFAAFDLDLEVDGFRLHARYDKERALDLGQLVTHTAEVLCLLPYLMDLDWFVGGLDYPPPVRLEVARAWARRLRGWGVLPIERLLTADRRRLLAAVEHDPIGGVREIAWDGRSAYPDMVDADLPGNLLERLRATLADLDLAPLDRWPEGGPWAPGQIALERTVLEPLHDAVQAGWIEPAGDGLRRAPAAAVRREHEAVVLARRLARGGEPLQRALATARLVRPIEPHLRFRTTGSVAGGRVDEARLWLATGPASLAVLRDAGGTVRLAIAVDGRLLVERRDGTDGDWKLVGEVPPNELERRLRRDAYPITQTGPLESASAVASELTSADRSAVGRLAIDERAVAGIAAAPGRAAGPVRFGTAGRTPEALDGAVLVAPTVAPADAPYLQHAAAIVSTGGGVLSHAGLIALELGRPSLVVEGRWTGPDGGSPELVLRRERHRDETLDVDGLEVVCHRGLTVFDETLRDGDLVEVDADRGRLVLLGRDLDALTAWAAVAEIRRLGRLLSADGSDDARVLEHRGRLLRAVHQLERLADRITSPTLVRFLVWEMLVELPTAVGAPVLPAVRRVLTSLQTAAGAGEAARGATAWCRAELGRRLADRLTVARELVAGARTPFEPLLGRAAVRRMAAALAEATALTGGGQPEIEASLTALDGEVRDRLRRQRASAMAAVGEAADEPRRTRPALARLATLCRVLGPLPDADEAKVETARSRLADVDAADRRRCRDRLTLAGAEVGVASSPEVGGKAAALGELCRVLGEGGVPAFFVVTRRAFREVLRSRVNNDGDPLEVRVRAALAAAADDPGAASRAVRRLWEQAALPHELETDVAERVRILGESTAGVPAFAVRSSGIEEDTAVSAWAGQFDTFLGVVGSAEVLRCLRLAWAGLWTERAVSRRSRTGIGDALPGGGVIVQRMVPSRVSGVVHTAALASGRPDEMVVNVGLGLGEGVVAGTVEVDHVVVAKSSLGGDSAMRFRYLVGDKREQVVADPNRPGETIRRSALAHQRLRPALEYRELEVLVRTALALEEAWGEPLDIEFAFDGPQLRVLQARPVPAVHTTVWTTEAAWPLGGRTA